MMLEEIETPALVLDAGIMERNIARLRERLGRLGVALRPHVKTAKSIEVANRRLEAGEPVGDLLVRGAALNAVEVPAARAPSMIDEYLVLGVAAACARGRTVMRGLAELRVKESDRLAALVDGLTKCGVTVALKGDDLAVEGVGGAPPGGAVIATRLDHRIAMSFLVMGLAARQPVTCFT